MKKNKRNPLADIVGLPQRPQVASQTPEPTTYTNRGVRLRSDYLERLRAASAALRHRGVSLNQLINEGVALVLEKYEGEEAWTIDPETGEPRKKLAGEPFPTVERLPVGRL